MDKFKVIDIKNIDNLPKTAGVYAFYKKSPQANKSLDPKPYTLDPIYIGKAINIKNRVKNHFSSPTYKDNIFISQITNIGFIETGNEIQALILEANLIKKHQPKFNQVWRDDKNYFFIAIAQNKLGIPYIYITHQPQQSNGRVIPGLIGDPGLNIRTLDSRFRGNDSAKYIGPFVDGNALKKTIRFLRKVFPYYTASKHSKLKCTYCHLDLCPGPQPDIKEYKKNIKKLILVLEGKSSKVLNSLKKEMKIASADQNFEKASKLRDQIFALEKIMSHKSSGGIPSSPEIWKNTEKNLQKILNFNKAISKIECYDVSNIQGKFATASMVVFINGKADKNQYKKFRIKGENSSSTNFRNNKHLMKNKDKSTNNQKLVLDEPNDIAMLKEVLQRRFVHTEWKYPEIILIDGGKAQLNVAISVIPNLIGNPGLNASTLDSRFSAQGANAQGRPASGVGPASGWRGNDKTDIKVISIAKGRQELFIENQKNPIPLKELPQEIYNLIKNLDDQAHRFAITYHKKLRRKNLLN